MIYDNNSIVWYVLFAANGKIAKMKPYLDAANIEHFFPTFYKEKKVSGQKQPKRMQYPILGNLLFVKSSKAELDPILKRIKLQLNITSDLYYRDLGSRQLIVVPDDQMLNFIAVAGSGEEQIIYLSNEEVRIRKGTKVRITGGAFAGVEGVFMRIKGDKRLVVSLHSLGFSVATAYLPSRLVLPLE